MAAPPLTRTMTALLSVYDKTGIGEVALQLSKLGYELIASKGTVTAINEQAPELAVRNISEFTGHAPILGHKVVTLSPEVHGALLCDLSDQAEVDELERELGIRPIGLVYVNLYPMEAAIAAQGATMESVRALTDIGGPAMLRAAAKGRRIVVGDPDDLSGVLTWMKVGMPDREQFLLDLAAKAEAICARYALASATYLGSGKVYGTIGRHVGEGFKGENGPQSPAHLYSLGGSDPLALERFEPTLGAPLGYVNWTDLDRLLQTMTHIAAAFDVNYGESPCIAVGVKHGNPCGAAVGDDPMSVIRDMVAGDPLAIMGGFVMTNFPVDGSMAELLRRYQVPEGGRRPLDGLVAPSVDDSVLEEICRRDNRGRVLVNPALGGLGRGSLDTSPILRLVRGGFIVQPNRSYVPNFNDGSITRYGQATREQERDMLVAWAVCATSNSNTITIARDGMLLGNGVGQQDRVGGAVLALCRARRSGHDVTGAVACSDSFFPFPDGALALARKGVKAIFATEGGMRFNDVVQALDEKGVVFYTIPDGKGRGFFGH